jgi:opacity protein-like surface antigen
LRPEDIGIVPIGANTPTPAASTSEPIPLDTTDDSPRSLEDFLGPNEGPVFRTAVGVNLLQPWSTRFGNQSIYSKTIFNPGIRYDLEAGYNILPQLRLSVEGDFIYNSIHSVVWENDTRYGTGSLYQVPVLFNATYHYLSQGPFRGYVGAGVGANWMIYQSGTALTEGATYTSYQWNFAWQFTTGFTYTIQPGFDLDIGYKCLSMPSPNFADFGTSHAMFNHTAEIGLAWRF